MLGWAVGVVTVLMTLLLGIAIFSWSALVPDALPQGLKPDQVLVAFIQSRLPAGLAGLMVAAIFAAAMSSVDSAVQSLSTATTVDFVQRFRKSPLSDEQELRLARFLTLAFGVAALFIALQVSKAGTGLLETMVTWLGYFAGPLLGLFLLGMLTKRANETGALAGMTLAFTGIAVAVQFKIPAKLGCHPLWLAPAAVATTFLSGLAASGLKKTSLS
jgi:SSS family solute:Na+ symporter